MRRHRWAAGAAAVAAAAALVGTAAGTQAAIRDRTNNPHPHQAAWQHAAADRTNYRGPVRPVLPGHRADHINRPRGGEHR